MFFAAIKLLQYAREEWGVDKIYSTADCENLASRRTLEKVVERTKVGSVEGGKVVLTWPVGKMGVKTEEERERESFWWEWSTA
jgi:hypothetical protein